MTDFLRSHVVGGHALGRTAGNGARTPRDLPVLGLASAGMAPVVLFKRSIPSSIYVQPILLHGQMTEPSAQFSHGDRRVIRILSNITQLQGLNTQRFTAVLTPVPRRWSVRAFWRFMVDCERADVAVINNEARTLMLLCVRRLVLRRKLPKLVSVDIVLSKPAGVYDTIRAWLKRQLFRAVDKFVLYFRDLEGFERYYGILGERTIFVPFKVNIWHSVCSAPEPSSEGSYVLMAGRTMRDVDTFVAAMATLGYPAVLLHQQREILKQCGTRLNLKDLPKNVTAILDEGGERSWIEYIAGAKIVALPTHASSISPSGISTYLDAMALKKCVILTEGPATRGLIRDEAVIVPPQNPSALAAAIRAAWENPVLRESIASAGYRYAQRLGGEERLLTDILNCCGELVAQTGWSFRVVPARRTEGVTS